MRRPRWTYRPLRCLVGLHSTSLRWAATLTPNGDLHATACRVVTSCDRAGCTYTSDFPDRW